ncbi:Atrial natriuretic peptide receptor 3 [Folsomia candida]|uniref:Atrial natriuretic peptide receptor 3 n=1 Tax=Folsomia candida TaxID=158441 RepID=A0A226DH32_FOLCA|nr:Atrial natriuretic peptide receptor 3 [Folsomia candida]
MNVKKSKSCPPTCRDLSIISLLCLCCLIPGGRCFLEENNKSVVAREIAPFHQLAPEEIPPWEETGDEDKVVNVTVLLPFNHTYQPSLKRVGPAILLGFETVRRLQLLPQYRIALTYHDSQCSNVFAPMRATRATMNEGNVHVFFGPSCELALGKGIF